MVNSRFHMLFYLFVCVWLVKSFPASVLREHISVPDNSSNFNGPKIVIIHFEKIKKVYTTQIIRNKQDFFEIY